MSDKLFKGQTTLGMIAEFLFWSTPEFLSYIIALVGAALGARDGRPADEEQRADRDARVRHQPVSDGAADGRVRAGRQRDAVRDGRARARHRQPTRRSPEAHHPHRHRRRPLACSIASGSSAAKARSITTSITTRATASCTACRSSISIRRRTPSSPGCSFSARHTIPRSRRRANCRSGCSNRGGSVNSIRRRRLQLHPFRQHLAHASNRPTISSPRHANRS